MITFLLCLSMYSGDPECMTVTGDKQAMTQAIVDMVDPDRDVVWSDKESLNVDINPMPEELR